MDITTIATSVERSLNVIRNHPFILAAHSRKLTKEQSLRWIFCAGRESQSFPVILIDMLRSSENPVVREILEENLADELGHGVWEHAHFTHYLQLLEMLGVNIEHFHEYEKRSGIQLALSLAHNIAQSRNVERALGYMIVNEAMTPITYLAAKETLTGFYPGINTNFFDIHITVDEHHVAELYKALEAMESDPEEVCFGVELGERGMATLLDEAYGIYHTIDDFEAPSEKCPQTMFNSLLEQSPIKFEEHA